MTPTPATRRSGRGQTLRDSIGLKRSLSIAKRLVRGKMACKMEALNNSIGDHHNMPPKCNTRITKLNSMSSSTESEDQMVDKTSMHKKIWGWLQILDKEAIVGYSRRTQGDIKAKRRCTTEAEEKSTRECRNIRSRLKRARAIWAMRMTWMKVLLWLKEGPRRGGAIRKFTRRDSLTADVRSTKRPHRRSPGREDVHGSLCMTLISKLVTEVARMGNQHSQRECQITHRRSNRTSIKKLQLKYFTRSGTVS